MKGATRQYIEGIDSVKYFNPRTREGCDWLLGKCPIRDALYFNPRTREGCDAGIGPLYGYPENISIHAPVKGATKTRFFIRVTNMDFNPRTREGCDRQWGSLTIGSGLFQSTHP